MLSLPPSLRYGAQAGGFRFMNPAYERNPGAGQVRHTTARSHGETFDPARQRRDLT